MTNDPTTAPRLLDDALQKGLKAARANAVPGLMLQSVALGIVAAYVFWPAARRALEEVAELKARSGYAFSALSTAFFAGVLPLFLQRLQRGTHRRENLQHLPFFIVFWAVMGVIIDAFFWAQSLLFGDNSEASTVIKKVLFDQFFFSPVIALTLIVAAYEWKDSGFDFVRWRAGFGHGWYARRVFPVVVSAWAVWLPTLIFLYYLPSTLQLPFQNAMQSLWSLILMLLTREESVA